MEYISTSSSNVSSDDLSLWQIIPCYSDDLGADSLSSYQNIIEQFGFKGGAGDSLLVPKSEASEQSLLWGLGEQNKQTSSTLAKAGAALAASLEQYRIPKAILDLGAVLTLEASIVIQTLIKQIDNKHYQFDKYKSKKADPVSLKSLAFISSDESATEKAITYGKAQSTGVSFAKNLGNEPGNVCTPDFLASEALQLSETGVIDVEVLSEPELEKMGMGAFVSVSKGSSLEGKLIVMKYNGGDDGAAPHVLVGKGITFDTGGISLKPGAQMDEMKYDMCGAASVLGTMKAIAELKPALNIIGVVAAAENMPAGNASKPGDIVTTLSGQTVEILNTDAEGRLVLCDALTYVERFKPASVIDIATLTGACIIALGHSTSAVMSNNEELVEQILKAGTEANDKAWQLPIWDEYQTQIDSPFADMQNIGGKGAGSITAACFLSRFTKEYAWAHLDIAGTAWVSGGKDKGATGRPVPLLLQYLLNQTS